jgi:thymidylate kinase
MSKLSNKELIEDIRVAAKVSGVAYEKNILTLAAERIEALEKDIKTARENYESLAAHHNHRCTCVDTY